MSGRTELEGTGLVFARALEAYVEQEYSGWAQDHGMPVPEDIVRTRTGFHVVFPTFVGIVTVTARLPVRIDERNGTAPSQGEEESR